MSSQDNFGADGGKPEKSKVATKKSSAAKNQKHNFINANKKGL